MKKIKYLLIFILISTFALAAAGCVEEPEPDPDLYDIEFSFTGETTPIGWLQKYGRSEQSGGDYDMTLSAVVEKYLPQTDWSMTYTDWQTELKKIGKESLIANDIYDFTSAEALREYLDAHTAGLFRELAGVTFAFGSEDSVFPMTISVPGKEDIVYNIRNLAGDYFVSYGEGLAEAQLNINFIYYATSEWLFDFSVPYSVLGAGNAEKESYSCPLTFRLKDSANATLCSISVRPSCRYTNTDEQ